MKLLLCPECRDIRRLGYDNTVCDCGESWGNYREDGLYADVHGRGLIIGLSNPSLTMGIRRHREKYPEDNITIEAWIMSEPARHVDYHRAGEK